jgi:hypothetical protein
LRCIHYARGASRSQRVLPLELGKPMSRQRPRAFA